MDNFETAKKLFIEGLQYLEANHFRAAEASFARSLEFLPNRVSTLNNLAAVKNKLEAFPEAEMFALKAIAVDSHSPEAWASLGFARFKMKRPDEALQAFDRALQLNPAHIGAWLNKAETLLELQRNEEALQACDQALKLGPGQHGIWYVRSLILKELKQLDEAQKTYAKSLKMRTAVSPLLITERRATQQANILVFNHNPVLDSSLKSYEALQLENNFPGQLTAQLSDDFHFTYVFECDAARPETRRQIPQPNLLINNHTNAESFLAGGNLLGLIELVDSFGAPVVNHPAKALQTTRDATMKLLQDIPGVLIPKTTRFSMVGKTPQDLVREIEDQYDYPLITRTLYLQQGEGMTKVDSREALVKLLVSGIPEHFFVTQFVPSKGQNIFFRKIRAAVVDQTIIIIRVDHDTNWCVHARKSDERVAFYQKNLYLLEEEKKMCLHAEENFGKSALRSLQAIRARIPLEIFGIDFDVDPDGMLVFYEANATMNLFGTVKKEVAYPQEAEDALRLSFRRYFISLTTRR